MKKISIYTYFSIAVIAVIVFSLSSCAPPSLRQTISDIVNMTVYLTSPENEGRVAAKTPLLNWEDAGGATGYELQIVDDIDQLEGSTVIKLTKSEYEMPGMTICDQKFWRVRAAKEGEPEPGPWSETRSFEIVVSESPKLIAQLGAEDGINSSPVGITVNGNYAYIGHDTYVDNHLEIVDISNPDAPKIVATLTVSSGFFPAVYGDYLYCDQGLEGISKVDISDPEHPKTVGRPCLREYDGDSSYYDLMSVAYGTNLYLAVDSSSTTGGLMTINFSDQDNPVVKGVDKVSEGHPFSVIKISATAALLSVKGVGVVTFSTIGEDSTATYAIDNMNYGALETSDKYAFVGNISGPLTILDISSPFSLSHVYTYDPGDGVGFSAVSGHYLFADLNSSQTFTILDIWDPSAPVLISEGNTGAICEVVGNYAYGVESNKGKFDVYDLVPGD